MTDIRRQAAWLAEWPPKDLRQRLAEIDRERAALLLALQIRVQRDQQVSK